MKRIGVLALQGGFAAHARALDAIGASVREVRAPADLRGLDGIVMPGGESVVQSALLDRLGLREPLGDFVRDGAPVLATCAGLILASRAIALSSLTSYGWLDVVVLRNAYGRQNESFEARSDDGALPLVFIRAPRIVAVGAGVRVLATWRGEAVLVQQDNVIGAAFHPELTVDRSVHARAFGIRQSRIESIEIEEEHAPLSVQAG
jgi:5'-phosphate synthase pdxT subunit